MYTDSNGNRWYKGNLHTHTTNSDGRFSPEDCAKLYKSHGYDFLAFTDHWKITSENRIDDNGLLILEGAEYDFGSNPVDGIFHIVGVGCTEAPGIIGGDKPQTIIDKIHAAGGVVNFAHPCWSMNTLEHIMPLHGIDFVEIFNSVSDRPINCRPYSGEIVDKLAARGIYHKLAATDDTHWYKDEACRSFVYVRVDECTRDAIIAAIAAGDFYASQGPRMTAERTEKGMHFTFPEEDGVTVATFVTDAVWRSGRSVLAEGGKPLTEADFTYLSNETFVRVEASDGEGRTVWSAIFPKLEGE